MRFPWVIVGGTGYDVEEVDKPRTYDMECPSCERKVRFVEKELIKNLRVFGVPIVGVEKGRRVFECPNCRVCVEPPDAEPAGEFTDPQIDAIELRLRKLGDDVWLWSRRAQVAADKGARDLEFEALEWKTKAEREVEALTEKLAALRSGSGRPEREAAPRGPAIVARKGGEVVDRGAEDDFAALKAKLARKQTDEPASSSAPLADATPTPPSGEEPAPSTPRASETASEGAGAAKDLEDEFAALKARRAQQVASAPPPEGSSGDAEYESLRRELRDGEEARPAPGDPERAGPESPLAAPPAPVEPPGGDDDDPVAALKKKLRGK